MSRLQEKIICLPKMKTPPTIKEEEQEITGYKFPFNHYNLPTFEYNKNHFESELNAIERN